MAGFFNFNFIMSASKAPALFKSAVISGLTIAFIILSPRAGKAQGETQVLDSNGSAEKTVVAGHYSRKAFHGFLFGYHYRREWAQPVKVRSVMLDTAFGGLTPYEGGGGRQSKSLKLRDKQGREFVLRSLDKSFGRALPELYQGTFIEDLVDDQVTIGHPYSAVTIAPLAEAAGILHTNPYIIYIPKQPALDSFNENFGNRMYLLEQRPDENWETAPNFGNSKKIIGTDKMLEKLLDEHSVKVDQQLYVRSRLFDLFIGDWGRHEDQWRWGLLEAGDQKIYRPIPRDRDQAYTKFDGVFPKIVLSGANLDHLQSFKENLNHVNVYSYPARHLDRRCANEMTLDQWTSIAKELQNALTDEVIAFSVSQLPPEVFDISGNEIKTKLRARRDHLVDYATEYYKFLARHVDVPGSKEREYFEVSRVDDETTLVQVYAISNKGRKEDDPYYSRVFKISETKDVRLYGIDGNDVFQVRGKVNDGIKIRIIGGNETDSIVDQSSVSGMRRMTEVYDNYDNFVKRSGETKLRLDDDSAVHAYDYEEYEYHKRGLKFSASYNNPDRIYLSLGYGFKRHMWRKYPYGFDQAVSLRYSLSQNAFSLLYQGKLYQLLGKWDMTISANYDAVRWTNFYGLGNETKRLETAARNYYQLRTNEFVGSVGLNRVFHKYHNVDLTAFFQAVEVINDKGRFVTDNFTEPQLHYFDHHQYLGLRLGYTFQHVNDRAVPTQGAMFYAGAAYSNNIEERDKSFTTLNSILQLYIPLVSKFSLSIRSGVTSVSGEPEFYQYASIGGSQNMRGFARDRFWGQTAFYNSNELRWITRFRTYLMNGKFGLVGFVDDGRVWMPGEQSEVWHVGYGGGILLSPFNKITGTITYGISDDTRRLHIRINRLLF